MKYIFSLIIAIVFLACNPEQAGEFERTGNYKGVFTYGNFSDTINLNIEKDSAGYHVFFSSLAQNANRIPFREVIINGDSINFMLRSDLYTYHFQNRWVDNGNSLQGVLKVDSLSVPFQLQKESRKEASIPKKQDLYFTSSGNTIHSTIWYPQNASNKGIVLLSSSGNADRSASRAEAIAFARRGFTTFHYDKRGTGQSEGNWNSATMEELLSDDRNAIQFFADKAELSLSNIGIKGSSQGGAKVPYLLTKLNELDYGIVVSCPGSSLLESDLNYWKNRNKLIPGEDLDAAADLQGMVFQYIAGTIKRERLEKEIASKRGAMWFENVWIPNLDDVQIDSKLNYSPIPFFKQTQQPLLIIQGTADEIIPADSHTTIADALKSTENNHFDVRLLKGANHSMYEVEHSDFPYWAKLHPDYMEAIVDWIEREREE